MKHWLGDPTRSILSEKQGSNYTNPTSELDATIIGHEDDGFARLVVSDKVRDLLYNPGINKPPREFNEIVAAVDLIRSELWRVKNVPKKKFIVAMENERAYILDRLSMTRNRGQYSVRLYNDFVAEARALTFVEKAMRTLENLFTLWTRNPVPFTLPHKEPATYPNFRFRYDDGDIFDGLVYGMNPSQAYLISEFLNEEGYVRNNRLTGSDDQRAELYTSVITPKGMMALDERARGKGSRANSVFFVRKYDPDLDVFLSPVMRDVEKRLPCSIESVWDKDHNDNIIEKIFSDIRESEAILVDLTGDRINVGIELGYALARGKQIVLIKHHPIPQHRLEVPFDIGSLNCFGYQQSEEGGAKLANVLEARIRLALETQREA